MRALIRGILLLILLAVVVVAASSYLGYRIQIVRTDAPAVGTSGDAPGSTGLDEARRRGGEIGQKIEDVGSRAEQFLSGSAITAKIKSKMALDDHVEASAISVETDGNGVVTLRGEVASEDGRRRALDLARDTKGVTSVVDHLRLK